MIKRPYFIFYGENENTGGVRDIDLNMKMISLLSSAVVRVVERHTITRLINRLILIIMRDRWQEKYG